MRDWPQYYLNEYRDEDKQITQDFSINFRFCAGGDFGNEEKKNAG